MTESPTTPAAAEAIVVEGARVHNLKSIDVRFPLHRMTVVTGVSGSGKSSLAFETLYAEGQRRYIESFSPYTRQFLERLEKPDADHIDNLPPAVALTQRSVTPGRRATVATATDLANYFRLLFAKAGSLVDPATGHEIRRDSPQSVAAAVEKLPQGRRLLIAFPATAIAAAGDDEPPATGDRLLDAMLDRGYPRLIAEGRLWHLARGERPASTDDALVVVDRLKTGTLEAERLAESLEIAFGDGDGRCCVLVEGDVEGDAPGTRFDLESSRWTRCDFNRRPISPVTGRSFTEPSTALFSFTSPLGACPTCRGFGSVPEMSWEKLVPDQSRSLREGAIVAWTTPAYRHELDELLALAGDYDLPVDVPFAELAPSHRELIEAGVPERNFGGLRGFFRWLERKRYKIGVAAFLARFRSYEPCPDCRGARLNDDALAVRVAGRTIADFCGDTIGESRRFFEGPSTDMPGADPAVLRAILPEIRERLVTLDRLGLGYLTLDRTTDTLSGGEARRVALTAAVGANLVNMLYVLDEPSAGLHPRDRERVIDTLLALRDAPNTVVVVEHDESFARAADWLVELGPGAGREGGEVTFMGQPSGGRQPSESSATSQRRSRGADALRSPRGQESLTLSPCTRHNLKGFSLDVPLGQLCVVSGVSGSGKSTLVNKTLYPALCRALGKPCDVDDADRTASVTGAETLNDVLLITHAPIGRSSRSNPATYLGAFDAIRAAFAATPEAKLRAFGPGTFSFNSDRGGRCPHCRGAGIVSIDMQFLPDVEVTCPECDGRRFRRDVLDVKLRGRSIAEVLEMTAAEAFTFFRGHAKIQRRLAPLKEVGLDYLPLGQPATTLSGGESQRLKIASFLVAGTGRRTLFLFDEPTIGLHASDVATLLDCFRRLIAVGHSLVVVEHRLDVIAAADWIIDLGPEAGDSGGRIVATGPPAAIAATGDSITGRCLQSAVGLL